MRTNIDIDDNLLEAAMRAGPFRTKKDAVEAGLQLLARKAAYQELLALQGKLNWDLEGDWSEPQTESNRADGPTGATRSKVE